MNNLAEKIIGKAMKGQGVTGEDALFVKRN